MKLGVRLGGRWPGGGQAVPAGAARVSGTGGSPGRGGHGLTDRPQEEGASGAHRAGWQPRWAPRPAPWAAGLKGRGRRGLGRAGAEPGRGAQLRGFRGAVWKAGRPTLVVCHENRARRRWRPASSRGAGWGPLTESRARPLSPRLGDGPGASEALVTSRACGPGQPRRGPSGHGATRHVAEDGAAAA